MISINLIKYPIKIEVPEKSKIAFLKKSKDINKNLELLDYVLDYIWLRESKKSDLFIVVEPHLFSLVIFNFPRLYYINEVPVSSKINLLKECVM